MKNYEKTFHKHLPFFMATTKARDSAKKLIIDQFHRETLFALRTLVDYLERIKAIMKHLGFLNYRIISHNLTIFKLRTFLHTSLWWWKWNKVANNARNREIETREWKFQFYNFRNLPSSHYFFFLSFFINILKKTFFFYKLFSIIFN